MSETLRTKRDFYDACVKEFSLNTDDPFTNIFAHCCAWQDRCNDIKRELSESQKAYTAAHSELERAVADLAACREVADRERERLAYVYAQQMNALVKPLMTYAEWLAAIDAAIKEQRHDV